MSVTAESTENLDTALAHASRLIATDPALAGEQASEIIKAVGEHPLAVLLLGVSHRLRGDFATALEILRPLAAKQANWAIAQLELGLSLSGAKRAGEAKTALQLAVGLKPDLPKAWLALGDQLMALDDADGADAAYANHVRYSTRDPHMLHA
ncbi:MAG: hypothetical protein ABI866_12895, partial [Dokdonella sp.]